MQAQATQRKYGFSRVVDLSYQQAIDQTKAALKEQGFGVLSEIDVQKTLKEKIGVDFPRYVILGACNPQLAHQALQTDPDIGLLLPCNVVVRERDGKTEVAVIDAGQMMSVVGDARLEAVATQANERLKRALEAI